MVLDPKHFDDMDDDFGDFDDKLDSSGDTDLGESGPNPLSWRRIIIERAANNVKKAVEAKTDTKVSYKKGSLVFDEQANKFGRVIESRPGFLNMTLLAGGSLVRQDVNAMDFVREHRQKLTLPEIAKALSLTEVEVIFLLNQVELAGEQELSATNGTVAKKDLVVKKNVAKAKSLESKKKPEVKMPIMREDKLGKQKPKLAAKKKKILPTKKKPVLSKELPVSFTKLLPKGATTDPIMDPNGYIQQNFLLMSNRELAHATGLSEHTIRRKLGEWNLKRRDFINKA
jgi:hypothetical protein